MKHLDGACHQALMIRTGALLLAAVALAALPGCNVGPKYTRPTYPTAPAFRGADDSQVKSDTQASLGDERWSEVFKEPELQELIGTALANNYDVRVAVQHVLEQEAQVRITRAAQFPTLSVGGTGLGASFPSSTLGNGSGSSGSSSSGIKSPIYEGSFNLSAAWTPDFWGLYRKQTEEARAQLLSQTWAQRAVRMTLVQDVVTDYLELRALDAQLVLTQQTVQVREQSLKLTQTLEQGGNSPLSDVRQAQENLYTATAEIPQLEQQIEQEENAINLLLGRTPGSIERHATQVLAPPPQDLPVGIPSQLLERRPDIVEAEQQLIQANLAIGVARAEFFPSLTINVSTGPGGDTFGSLFSASNNLTTYGYGSLAQPLFEGGKLKGQLALAKADDQEMVLTYQKTILSAFKDVSNALIASKKEREYREQEEKLVAAAQDSTRLARMRYQAGSTSYLEVLTTDTTLYSDELTLISAQQSEALTLVQLYSALGGGWQ
jgi:multidrug efflux system outer membrane protein